MHSYHQQKFHDIALLLLLILLLLTSMLFSGTHASAQSGRGLMHGYVAFEDVSYN